MKNNNTIGIVGDANSIYIKRFIEFIMLPSKKRFVLFTISNKTFFDYYLNNNVEVVSYNTGIHDSHSKLRIFKIFDCFKLMLLVNKYYIDNLIIHYVSPFMLLIFKLFNYNKKLLLVYWGSDVYRESKKILSLVNNVVNKSCLVTDSEDVCSVLSDLYGIAISDKINIIKFADSTLDVIDALVNKRDELRNELIGRNDKYVVTVGYSAIRQQQHIKVLNQLKTLSKEMKNKLFVVLPLTYPKDQKYVDELRIKLDEIGIEYLLIKEYMHEYEVSRLCISTDMFIHAQTTDSMSSSMIEHIYAGSYVVNGSWLNYEYLNKNNIKCASFDKFEQLPSTILKEPVIDYDLNIVKKIIAGDYSIDNYQNKWLSVINSYFK